MFLCNPFHSVKNSLQCVPAPGNPNESPVFHLRPRFEVVPVGLRLAKPALGEEPTCHRTEREQRYSVCSAKVRHSMPSALVEEREAHLV